jgi:type I restriction enzyme S subunit
MSANWQVATLGEVLWYRKEFIEINDLESYKRCRVQLHAQGIVLRDIARGAEIKTKKQQVCRAGEFLVAEIDAKVGGFGIVPPELDGAIVSSHYFLFEIDETKLDRRFLDYGIRTHSFRDQVTAQGSTNYAAVRPTEVLGYRLPLPTLEEQRRIVARIEELAAKIEEARGLRREAVTETESLLSAGSRAIASSLAGVTPRPIRDFVIVQSGGTPSKGNPFFWDGSIPWVSPKDMKSREIYDSADHISEAAILNSAAKLLAPGCVLVVVRGMILAHTVPAAVLRVEATINQDIKALLPTDDLLPEYLCSSLWAFNKDLLGLVEKSTHDTRRFETHKLLDFNLPVPPLEE